MLKQTEIYKIETTSSDAQLDAFGKIEQMYLSSPLPHYDMIRNFGLYTRSSLLAKFLAIDDLYRRIQHLPGAILEFGVWLGQDLIYFENLRAIYEPFNKQRRIIGFDTFDGYAGFSAKDKKDVLSKDTYSTSREYKQYLEELLKAHEGANVLGHITGNHELVEGDVRKTAPKYFKDHPETIVALAYFDLGLYEPTKAAIEAIKPHLIPGSVILFDELTWKESPGEAVAFKECFKDIKYKIEKSRYFSSKSVVTIE